MGIYLLYEQNQPPAHTARRVRELVAQNKQLSVHRRKDLESFREEALSPESTRDFTSDRPLWLLNADTESSVLSLPDEAKFEERLLQILGEGFFLRDLTTAPKQMHTITFITKYIGRRPMETRTSVPVTALTYWQLVQIISHMIDPSSMPTGFELEYSPGLPWMTAPWLSGFTISADGQRCAHDNRLRLCNNLKHVGPPFTENNFRALRFCRLPDTFPMLAKIDGTHVRMFDAPQSVLHHLIQRDSFPWEIQEALMRGEDPFRRAHLCGTSDQ
jgi:hypothetical protein